MTLKEPELQNLAREEGQHLLRSLAAVREIETAIATGVDLPSLLRLVLEKIDLVLPRHAAAAFILVLSRQTGRLEPLAHRNVEETGFAVSAWEAWSPAAKTVFETKALIKIADLWADTSVPGVELFRRAGWISYLGLPLTAQDEPLGVLSIYAKEPGAFGGEETVVLSLLAAQAAASIRQAQLSEQSQTRMAELESDNRHKNQFLRALSMELRGPLNSVVGYASLLQDRLLGEISPQQESALAGLLRSCQDQLKVINGIMEVMKMEMLKDQVLQGVRPLSEAVDEFEREVVLRALKSTGFNQTKAASLLGTTRRVLRYKMEKLKVTAPFDSGKKAEAERDSLEDEE